MQWFSGDFLVQISFPEQHAALAPLSRQWKPSDIMSQIVWKRLLLVMPGEYILKRLALFCSILLILVINGSKR